MGKQHNGNSNNNGTARKSISSRDVHLYSPGRRRQIDPKNRLDRKIEAQRSEVRIQNFDVRRKKGGEKPIQHGTYVNAHASYIHNGKPVWF
jgi:hypothetical protein